MDFISILYVFAASCIASVSASKNEHNSNKTKCVIGYLNSCLEHQKCVGISVGGRAGYCDCLEGYIDVEDGLGRQGCVSKNSTGIYIPSSEADQTSPSLATVLFVMILVLLGVAVIGVVVYVMKRVRLSRLRNRRMSGAFAAAVSDGNEEANQ